MIYTDEGYMFETIKKRDRNAHKGNFGKILLYAGSFGMAGAAVLCGRAALRTGSGLVRFLLSKNPSEIYPVLQTAVPEATCVLFSNDMDFREYDAIGCGSGIGQSEESLQIVKKILREFGSDSSKTLVMDADALNLLSKDDELAELVKNAQAAVIITPHIGEARRLLHTDEKIIGRSARKQAVTKLAARYHCIAILKGAGTLVAFSPKLIKSTAAGTEDSTPIFQVYENTTGNPGMATGGSGDSLTGIIVSLAGQGYAPEDAARAGVFLHGRAGDIAAEKLGEMSVTAGDIVDCIPFALKEFY